MPYSRTVQPPYPARNNILSLHNRGTQPLTPLPSRLKEYDLHLFDLPTTAADYALLDLLTIAAVTLTRRGTKNSTPPVEFVRSICAYLAGYIKITNGHISD